MCQDRQGTMKGSTALVPRHFGPTIICKMGGWETIDGWMISGEYIYIYHDFKHVRYVQYT